MGNVFKFKKLGALLYGVMVLFWSSFAFAGVLGDMNDDGIVGVSDVVTSLQIVSGQSVNIQGSAGDVNGDNRVGLAEAVNALQLTAEMRPPASVKLFRKRGLFTPTYSEVSLPYSSEGSVNATVLGGPQVYSLDTFKLESEGAQFTIVSVSASDNNGVVIPLFSGIQENYVLEADSSVTFECMTPLTGGRTVDLTYRFTIQETGETFRAHYLFRSN